MSRVDPNHLADLHKQTANIRNFCILAHVDHGKTTLSDSLVCSNGVISPKLAGKIRFLDSTEEEQQRGITMHSSAISLLFQPDAPKGTGSAAAPPPPPPSTTIPTIDTNDGSSSNIITSPDEIPAVPTEQYLINLVDSPGHIDFSSDVSTATRLCDGALIVIDVLEGLCTQTHAVLFKALKERMCPCLILNKIDRLVLEMKLTPCEAFHHLRRIVENANALAFTLLNSELMLRSERATANNPPSSSSSNSGCTTDKEGLEACRSSSDIEDPLIEEWTFSPEKGNVIFASALDCWGFGIARFANMWSKKLGLNKNILQKHMFEDFSFNPKTKKLVRCDPLDTSSQPMFATMVLEPLWQLYDAAVMQQNPEKAAKMAARGVEVELPPREVNVRDPRATAQAIFRRWLPLSDAVLRMVVRCMPNPAVAQKKRLFTLVSGVQEGHDRSIVQESWNTNEGKGSKTKSIVEEVQQRVDETKASIARCSVDAAADLVVFVSKMVPVRATDLSKKDLAMLKAQREFKRAEEQNNGTSSEVPVTAGSLDEEPVEVMMALARVFSGVLRRDSNMFVIGHRHDPVGTIASQISNSSSDGSSLLSASEEQQLDFTGELPSCFRGGATTASSSSSSATSSTGGIASSVAHVPAGSFGVYICLGPSVHPVEEVSAGNIVGIVGLDGLVLKTATLASTWACEPMRAITFQAKPMVCVAVEPLLHQNLAKLEAGLQSLYQFDPVVEVGVDDSGQHTMTCLGELHLEQCLKTLVERFMKCEIRSSEPLVAYRETILADDSSITSSSSIGMNKGETLHLPPPWGDLVGLSDAVGGRVRLVSSGNGLAITIHCFPLPAEMISLLEGDVSAVAAVSEFLAMKSLFSDLQEANIHEQLDTNSMNEQDQHLMSLLKSRSPAASQLLSSLAKVVMVASSSTSPAETPSSTVDNALISNDANKSKVGTGDNDALSSNIAMQLLNRLVSFGPKNSGPNLLIVAPDATLEVWSGPLVTSVSAAAATGADVGESANTTSNSEMLCRIASRGSASPLAVRAFDRIWTRLQSAVAAGFQTVSGAGPLMQEPLHGVGFSVEKIEINRSVAGAAISDEDLLFLGGRQGLENRQEKSDGTLAISTISNNNGAGSLLIGQLISDVTEALRLAILSCHVRVVEPIYACDLQCDQSQLGNLYAVLSKRRGQVNKEDIIEGTSLFLLSATLPVAESFGFAQELLKRTSGNGTAPQLQFSHWQCMEEDPFWRPTTLEELEDHGDRIGEKDHNMARLCIDKVRKRKGLPVEEKIVVNAEKQRTIHKKK